MFVEVTGKVGPPRHERKRTLVMIERILIASLICISALGADKGSTVASADGKQYKLVKPEKKLPNGAIEIGEYVLVGDKSGERYAMHLTPNGRAPSFWKIRSSSRSADPDSHVQR